MTPELVVLIAAGIAWTVIEAVYIAKGLPTISERVRTLFARYPPFGMLTGLVVGLFLGHFFWSQ